MQRRKAVLQEFAQSRGGTVSAFCMKCPDEILSVLMFPDDHISVQMLRSYFTMALLISRHPEGLCNAPPLLPYVPTCPVLPSTVQPRPIQPWFSLPAQPLERMLLLDRGAFYVPRHHCRTSRAAMLCSLVVGCLVCSWGLYPLVQKGSLNVVSASVLS